VKIIDRSLRSSTFWPANSPRDRSIFNTPNFLTTNLRISIPLSAFSRRNALSETENNIEIKRRHAANTVAATLQPPGPTFPHNWRNRQKLRWETKPARS
jgi:hypothetical protein